MSHDSRKWGILGMSRTRSEVALDRNEPPPHIPEDGEAPPSPSTPLINISSPAALTPPKKAWERHYRSFLTKRAPSSSPGQVQTPPSPGNRKGKSELDDNVSQSNGGSHRNSKFSLVPGSKRLLTRQLPDKQPQQTTSMPSMPVLTKSRSQSSGDMTVKGGNFFSHVFHKHDASSKSKNPSPVVTRKIKSMDALDSTIRRGQEKTYSPKNQRFVHADMDLGGPPGPSTPSLASSTSTTPHGSPLPLHPSSPRSRHHHAKAPALLPKALSSSGTAKKGASTETKKAFTEFHNSSTFSKDSTSAYLGDDTSATGNTYFAMYNQMATQHKDSNHAERSRMARSRSSQMLSRSLDPVVEGSLLAKSQRMLKPVVGPEAWGQGRRYLISPAILATCPMQVLPTLSGNRKITSFDETVFGALELGAATMSYIGTRKQASGWSACTLVLRQNYLLEYDRDTVGTPRGFAHLQSSRASPHIDFHNALELEFFGSPCAKSDKRRLLIRVENTSDRDRWVTCLNRAAALTVSDLYAFDESKLIGTGRYATVYRARRRETNGTHPECAIKIVDKNEFWGRVVKGMERADTLVREASVQATLTTKGDKLPTVVKISSLFETSDSLVLEVELLEGTDLFNHVSSKSVLDESEAASIVRDILVSLEAMNRFGVAHRDIKPANILMCNKAKDGVNVKVADFGMATFVGVDGQLRGRCGTPGYVAPEIFSAGIHGGYGNKVDIFSAGVTLYVMLCGYEPFYGETDAELIDANREAQVEFPDDDWERVSRGARELVQAMLEADPKKRISAKDALQHPWVRIHTEPAILASNSAKKFVDGAACTIS